MIHFRFEIPMEIWDLKGRVWLITRNHRNADSSLSSDSGDHLFGIPPLRAAEGDLGPLSGALRASVRMLEKCLSTKIFRAGRRSLLILGDSEGILQQESLSGNKTKGTTSYRSWRPPTA